LIPKQSPADGLLAAPPLFLSDTWGHDLRRAGTGVVIHFGS
jgi:hypothetical protein